MKIAQIACDWKSRFSANEINEAKEKAGGLQLCYDCKSPSSDCWIMFVSSHKLSDKQVEELGGDFWNKDVVSGRSFKEIVDKISKMFEDEMV